MKGRALSRRTLMLAALPLAMWRGAAIGAPALPTIRLSTGIDAMPLSARDAQGHYAGMIISALDVVNAELGWRFDYADVPWKRSQTYVRQGLLDALCGEPTVERRTYARFASAPLFTFDSRWAHFAAGNLKPEALGDIARLDQLRGLRIGVTRGDAWPNAEIGPDAQVTEVESLDLLDGMVRAGRIDMFIEAPEIVLALNRKTGQPPLASLHLDRLQGGIIPYTFGLRKSFPDLEMLIGRFNDALKRASAAGAIDAALAPFRATSG